MTKFYENKLFIIPALFLLFGAVTVIATTIGDSGFSGLQVDNYFAGSGKQGITQNISFGDSDGNNHSLEFEDGLLVNYSFEEAIPTAPFPSNDLVAYWKFDESSGDALDSVTGTYNGTNNGGTQGIAGKIGNAISLDGTDDWVNVTEWNSLWSSGQDSSFSAWIYWDGNTSGQRQIITWWDNLGGNDIHFGKHSDSSETMYGDSWQNTGTFLESAEWMHIVGTIEGTTAKIYINGELNATNSGISTPVYGEYLVFGRQVWLDAEYFDGDLDEIGVWNRTLNSTEVSNLYNEGYGNTY